MWPGAPASSRSQCRDGVPESRRSRRSAIDTRARVTYLRPDMTTSEVVLGIAGGTVSPEPLEALLGKLGGGLRLLLGS